MRLYKLMKSGSTDRWFGKQKDAMEFAAKHGATISLFDCKGADDVATLLNGEEITLDTEVAAS
jgi:hypothetical protein